MTQATGREDGKSTAQQRIMTEDEAVITERAAELGWEFALGAQYTSRQVAERYGLTYQGANELLKRISRPCKLLRYNGVWMKTEKALEN